MIKEELKGHLEKLGFEAEDKITGFKGVVDSVSFDLYGCIQYALRPPMDKEGKLPNGAWFDSNRIKIKGKKRIIEPLLIEALDETPSKPAKKKATDAASGRKGPADLPVK